MVALIAWLRRLAVAGRRYFCYSRMTMTRFSQSNSLKLRDNAEAPVEELLHDPIVQQLMDSDRVTSEAVVRLLAQIAARSPYTGSYDSI
jgi:hypothetical protein